MLHTTVDAMRALLKADPSLTPADRARILATLRNHGDKPETGAVSVTPQPAKIIRRSEAAKRLGCSLRAIDNWARAGILQKVKLPGRTRAAGFRESDLVKLIEGGAAL